MLAELKPTSRENWRTVRFGDVVRNVKFDVDPKTSGLKRFVAGEHMKTENLHIRSWGLIGDNYLGPAFHRKFVKGQVLYGSRRTYLRKVAVAEFEGICANTTFILEPKTDELLPELLPFIMQTESFHEHSIKQSRGSVNPYVNFTDINWYEFALPPKDEQRRIAEILWSADEVTQKFEILRENLIQHQTQSRQSIFGNGQNWKISSLGDLFEVQLGKMLSPKAKTGNSPKPYLGNSNVQWGKFELDELKTLDFNDAEKKKFALKSGDLLVCEGGEVGRSAIWNGEMEECYYQKAVHRLRPKSEETIPKFYLEYMFYAAWKGEFQGLTGHSTIAHLPAIKLKSLSVPVPSFDEQSNLMKVFENLENSIKAAESKILSSKSLVKELTKKLLLEN